MDRSGVVRFGLLLAVVFVATVAVGAFIGRQQTGQPVNAVTTPSPAASAVVTASPSPVLPTLPPTLTPVPTVPATPTAAPTVLLDPDTAELFAARLLEAFQTGDTQYLFDRLHPAVIARYNISQCRMKVDGFSADPSATWTVVSSGGPAAWSWVTDDTATTIDDAWTVTVKEPARPKRDLHFAPYQGLWRWFLDCGEPHA
jgi:hypothetical protein